MRYLSQALDIHGTEAGVEHTVYRPLFYWIYLLLISVCIPKRIPKTGSTLIFSASSRSPVVPTPSHRIAVAK